MVLIYDHPLEETKFYHWRSGNGVAPLCDPSINWEDGRWVAHTLGKVKNKQICPRCELVAEKLSKGWDK